MSCSFGAPCPGKSQLRSGSAPALTTPFSEPSVINEVSASMTSLLFFVLGILAGRGTSAMSSSARQAPIVCNARLTVCDVLLSDWQGA